MAEILADTDKHCLLYLFRQNKLVGELRHRESILRVEQIRVQKYVSEAGTQAINKDIEDWLTEANTVLNNVQSLELRIEETNRCFSLYCYWRQQYQLSKELDQTITAISKLVLSSKFLTQFFRSKSSISAFNNIMKALKDDEVNMIAVWGMAGVGKTDLVKEVCSKAKSLHLFHKVIFVSVSQTHDIDNIQDQIADILSLKLQGSRRQEKSDKIRDQLKKTEKVLIFLDDVWKSLNLEDIGIPLSENGEGCKIILTTRLRQVCRDMESQVTVSVVVLKKDEAWTLFMIKASLDDASPLDIINVAQKVAQECGGLPLAIVAKARALRSKDLNEWESALNQLNSSVSDDSVYLSLKSSYDYLSSETTKRCFLLCALHPKDYSINVEYLVRYAWGLELYQDADSIEDLRREVLKAIEELKDSCLLSEDNKKGYIKMHHVGRHAALRIASEEDNDFVVWLRKERPQQEPEFLLLDDSHNGITPIEYFEGMPELKVLSLDATLSESTNKFFSLNALTSLVKLRVLQLKGFKRLQDISALAKLRELHILSLLSSEFNESVDSLGELKNLIVLDIHQCKFLLGFPRNVIQRLDNVKELYLYYSSVEESINTPILRELNFLNSLSSLLLEVPCLRVSEDFVFPKVDRFRIAINRRFQTDPMAISPRFLTISERLPLNLISELLWEVEFLELSNIMENDIKCLTDTTPTWKEGVAKILQNLKDVRIEDCRDLQVIFQMESAEDSVLSNLKGLSLQSLPNLEFIWKIPTQRIGLQSLEAIKMKGCGNLKSLFSFSLAQTLVRLQRLEIDGCGELNQIVEELEGDEREISQNNPTLCLPELSSLEICNCDKLDYIFPKCMLPRGFPKLENLLLRHLHGLKQICRPAAQREENGISLLPEQELFPSLKNLTLSLCPILIDARIHKKPLRAYLKSLSLSNVQNQLYEDVMQLQCGYLTGLKWLKIEKLYELQVIWKDPGQILALRNLSYLTVSRCYKLKTIFTVLVARNLPQLSYLEVEGCEELEQVVVQEQILPPLMASHKLTRRRPVCFPNLVEICIMECNKLKSLFPVSFSHLPKLKRLEVKGASELREIFGHDSEANMTNDEKPIMISLPELEVLILEGLPKLLCFTPLDYYLAFPVLISLRVNKCRCTEIMRFSFNAGGKDLCIRAEIQAGQESRIRNDNNGGSSVQNIEVDGNKNISWYSSRTNPDDLGFYTVDEKK